MKKAVAILNRNMPEITDKLVESLIEQDIDADLFVLENGSDKDKYSKYANLFAEESNGVAWGVNRLLQHCLDNGYDYIWLNFNDARVNKPKEFFDWAIATMEIDNNVGICTPVWGSMWGEEGLKVNASHWETSKNNICTFFDDLTYVVSRKALETTSKQNRLTPFFDQSNYSNHYNMVAVSYELAKSGMYIVTNKNFKAEELNDADNDSEVARGYSNDEWKNVKGAKDIDRWINSYFKKFKDLEGTNKQKRDIVIQVITHTLKEQGII